MSTLLLGVEFPMWRGEGAPLGGNFRVTHCGPSNAKTIVCHHKCQLGEKGDSLFLLSLMKIFTGQDHLILCIPRSCGSYRHPHYVIEGSRVWKELCWKLNILLCISALGKECKSVFCQHREIKKKCLSPNAQTFINLCLLQLSIHGAWWEGLAGLEGKALKYWKGIF